jgi:hypothetical protein
LTYEVILSVVCVTTVGIIALVIVSGITLEHGTYIAVIAYTSLTALLINETREDRLSQRRPLIVVDIDDPAEEEVGRILHRPGPRLNVRNRGLGAATMIKLGFSERLLDRDEKPLAENPVLRDGIRYLGPGQKLSIALEKNFWFVLGVNAQTPYRSGDPPPPTNPATVCVTSSYSDPSSRRTFHEEFVIDVAPEVFGWSLSDD